MTALAEKILGEALVLSPIERATIIEQLFRSFDVSGNDALEKRWASEAESRISAFAADKILSADESEVMQRINRQ